MLKFSRLLFSKVNSSLEKNNFYKYNTNPNPSPTGTRFGFNLSGRADRNRCLAHIRVNSRRPQYRTSNRKNGNFPMPKQVYRSFQIGLGGSNLSVSSIYFQIFSSLLFAVQLGSNIRNYANLRRYASL